MKQEIIKKRQNTNVKRNAIILAAGFGMRMVPINLSTPKGLLEVNGETLIERLIKQLNDVGVFEIFVVVGFMKEKFSYLQERYGVKLIENDDYSVKNNLSSLALVVDHVCNTYILPADLWCDVNPFNQKELHSWYMVSDALDLDSFVRINGKKELIYLSENILGNAMIGISYIEQADSEWLIQRVIKLSAQEEHRDSFWEAALYSKGKMLIPGRMVHAQDVTEINTYEQLRKLDGASSHLQSEAIDVISEVFQTSKDAIVDITVLKKGMTNRSFRFSVNGTKYIMRIPGEGTEHLIDRKHEAEVFRILSGKGLCDDPVYINPANGYKITRYLDGIRVADSTDEADVTLCMNKLKDFHMMNLQVSHSFDLFGQIEYYESLWGGKSSAHRDYHKTKKQVFSLRNFIEKKRSFWCLTHIDAVPDNFLFYQENGEEKMQLTDWEYAGMQDPHLDLAMWSIY